MASPRRGAVAWLAAAMSLMIFVAGCNRVDRDPSASTVPGASAAPKAGQDPALSAAATQYHDYVVSEVAALQTTTRSFTDAVRAGDIAAAKALYPPARSHYEAIESVVESLGEFDDDIDARVDDQPDPAKWIGFHRIEKALWADGSLAGMAPYANELDLDIFALKARVGGVSFAPVDVANRAADLLVGVSTIKIGGEEERYSHTDLWDIAANIAGARKAFDLLKPGLDARDRTLAQQIESRFADVTATLDRYRRGPGYVDWSTVPQSELRALSEAVDALAEPLSQVAATLV